MPNSMGRRVHNPAANLNPMAYACPSHVTRTFTGAATHTLRRLPFFLPFTKLVYLYILLIFFIFIYKYINK